MDVWSERSSPRGVERDGGPAHPDLFGSVLREDQNMLGDPLPVGRGPHLRHQPDEDRRQSASKPREFLPAEGARCRATALAWKPGARAGGRGLIMKGLISTRNRRDPRGGGPYSYTQSQKYFWMIGLKPSLEQVHWSAASSSKGAMMAVRCEPAEPSSPVGCSARQRRHG